MKPLINKCEDGSTLIEFLERDWRFYISIEKNPAESSWGFCSNECSESGDLSPEFLNLLKEGIS